MRAVTDATFEQDVLQAGRPVVVDFWAPWCGPCKAIEPALEELAETTDKVDFVKLDIDENPGIAHRFGVLLLPTAPRAPPPGGGLSCWRGLCGGGGGEPRETVYGARQKKHFQKTFSPYF